VLGTVIAAGSIAGYIWSRTAGMPGMNVEEWFSPYGIVSLFVESIFILLVLLRPWKYEADGVTPLSGRSRYTLLMAGFLLAASSAFLANRWDYLVTTDYGHHVGSLSRVCSTPVTSFVELEERYGVQVSLVATSMMDSIVDVRLKIIDPEKASALLKNQAALLVDQKVLILAPHMHHHNSMKRDTVHYLFFSTQNNTIHAGSEVSLVFGPVRVDQIRVK
jgi:hypothetical protein